MPSSTRLWLREPLSPHDFYAHGLKAVLVQQQTRYQELWIVESETFGKALLLDGSWQSATADEHLYHEPLVHVPSIIHGAPRTVLILGGGEGATAREVLRWRDVESVVMVDIDGEVVEACREHLPEMHCGAFDDPRLEVVIGDALGYLDRTQRRWDLIISDLSEPVEDGPSYQLFTREHFESVRAALASGGVFVLQAGSLSHHEMTLHARIANTLQAVFREVVSYPAFVPSFATPWGFVVATDRPLDRVPDPIAVDELLATRVEGPLSFVDGTTFLGLLQTPRHVREAIAAEDRVYTRADPPRLKDLGARS